MKIEVLQGDITKIEVDGMVNAANSRLAGGGGVDGAIHRAGGPGIMTDLDRIRDRQGGCKTGEAVITSAVQLPAQKVIHAVGPVWSGGTAGENEKLAGAYRSSLALAAENNLKTVSFPNINTDIYGYPKEKAADVAISAVLETGEAGSTVEKVIFVCFDAESYNIYMKKLGEKGLI